jgi:hypothetical protein
MGYFKRPIRRSTARHARRALVEPAREIPARGWQRCDDDIVPEPDTFLRFVFEQPGVGKVGLFQASACIDSSDALPAAARSQFRIALKWFNTHLPVPRRLPRTAVCWFRADAAESLTRLRTIVEIYRMAGFPVWMQATTAPGRIVYRDDYQVAAVPYRDRRMTSSTL